MELFWGRISPFPSPLNSLINKSRIFYVVQYSGVFQFFSKYSLLDEGIRNLKRKKKAKNMTTPYTNYFVIIVGLF